MNEWIWRVNRWNVKIADIIIKVIIVWVVVPMMVILKILKPFVITVIITEVQMLVGIVYGKNLVNRNI